MALWFVWAFDVQNGYHVLVHIGGWTLAILVGARIASIVIFGALARVFNVRDESAESLAHRHAYRYYPLLRRVIVLGDRHRHRAGAAAGVGRPMSSTCSRPGTIGHRFASALATIGVAAVIAVIVWEVVNVSVERRLDRWTTSGDLRARRASAHAPADAAQRALLRDRAGGRADRPERDSA